MCVRRIKLRKPEKVPLEVAKYQCNPSIPPVWVTYLAHRKTWVLVADYQTCLTWEDRDDHHRKAKILVKHGFVFDLASIPRVAWRAIAPFEMSVVAPLIHDVLYRSGGDLDQIAAKPLGRKLSRKEVDKMFHHLMKIERIPGWRRWCAYWAVRIFGGFSWKKSSFDSE